MVPDPRPLPLGDSAPDFALPGTDGRTWALADVVGPNGLVVMFICNHCPYVKAAIERIVRDMAELRTLGIGAVAINSNDAARYPEDSFEHMQRFARTHGLGFPYLHDQSQDIARAYGAVCTPDFFGFDRDRRLRYHGRLDDAGRHAATPSTRRELFEAMRQVAERSAAPDAQTASIGCSIKWKLD